MLQLPFKRKTSILAQLKGNFQIFSGVPLEGDRDFGELCGSHQGCQVPFRPPIPNVGLLLSRAAQLASIRQMSEQVSRGSAGEYQADERAVVAQLRWRVSGR